MLIAAPYFFIVDVESIGLHGESFAVAAQIFDAAAQPIKGIPGMIWATDPDLASGMKDNREWVAKNVPKLAVTNHTRSSMMLDFWEMWETAKKEFKGLVMAAECAWPVEARFLIECIEQIPERRQWRGPYPLHDIASIMLAAGMDPLATYERVDAQFPAHHPLGDVQHSAHCLAMALEKLRLREHAQKVNWEKTEPA